jgi:hypothetical protein
MSFTTATATIGQVTLDVYKTDDSPIFSAETSNSLSYLIQSTSNEGVLGDTLSIIETNRDGNIISVINSVITYKYSDSDVLEFSLKREDNIEFTISFWKTDLEMVAYTFKDHYVLITGNLNY